MVDYTQYEYDELVVAEYCLRNDLHSANYARNKVLAWALSEQLDEVLNLMYKYEHPEIYPEFDDDGNEF